MNQLLLKMQEQIHFLLSDYWFIARDGAYLEEELVGIEIVPRKSSRSSLCDLHFRVIPACISTDVSAEVLAGAHKAVVEAQFDRNPNVRFAARHFLLSARDERISHGDLKGLNVRLSFHDEGDPEISIDRKTDRNGELWFQDISYTALCSLTLMQSRPEPEPDIPFYPIGETLEVSVRAEPSAEPPMQVQPGSKPQILYLADRRIVALLEELVGGKAVLTLETHAEEFNGATVRFEWANERGEIKLRPSAAQDRWSGQRRLNESFKDLSAAVPNFEVLPR